MTVDPFDLPISRVTLSAFKGVGAKTSVELRPLSVVVGRNSVGKSTLLQALLVMSQAARADFLSTGVIDPGGIIHFNGELVRLGSFEEVRNFRMKGQREIELGLATRIYELDPALKAPQFASLANTLDRDVMSVMKAGFEIEFGAVLEGLRGSRAWIGQTTASVRPYLLLDHPLTDKPHEETTGDALLAELIVDSQRINEEGVVTTGGWTPHRITLRDFAFATTGHGVEALDTVRMRGTIPRAFRKWGTLADVLLTGWWDFYSEILSAEIRDAKLDFAQIAREARNPPSNRAVKQAMKDIERILSEVASRNDSYDDPGRRYGHDIRPSEFDDLMALLPGRLGRTLTVNGRKAIAKSMVELEFQEFVERFKALTSYEGEDRGWIAEALYEPWELRSGMTGAALIEAAADKLLLALRGLRYLGPIRRPSMEPGSSSVNIGPSGEYSSSVLRERAQDIVTVPVPTEFIWGTDWSERDVSVTEALNEILSFLDLATSVGVTDHGRYGIGFSVVATTSVGHEVDLTAVGVGVSQALPIALLLVLSEPGDVLVIEQPELHLHPAMQLRMADLLLRFAAAGRQIIVETHSEHLVNRLRRRVVEDPGTHSHLVALLFAETDDDDNTIYRESKIRDDGTLADDWPDGFFDVGASEATELLRALLQRQQATGQ